MKDRLAGLVPFAVGTLVCLPLLGAQRVVKEIPVEIQISQTVTQEIPGSTAKIELIPISGGKLNVGGKEVEVKPFLICKTETPWEAFDPYLQSGPATKSYDQTEYGPDAIARPSKSYVLPDKGWGHAGYPVINVSWETAMMYTRWLSSVTGKKFRLPTVAEWQFACNAGAAEFKPFDKKEAEKVAWFSSNAKKVTHPVGKKTANALGLFDMFGNAGEWALNTDNEYVLCGGTFEDDLSKLTPTEYKEYDPAWQEGDPQMPKSRWWYADGQTCGFRLVCEQ